MDALPSLANVQTTSRPQENWLEARRIYMQRAKDVLTPLVYETIYGIHQDAVQLAARPEDVERTFADMLAEARVWALNIINAETQCILQSCPWFATLLKGVFVSNVMVLSSAQLNRANAAPGKVRLSIPPCPVFVQALYTNVANRFFDNPHLFRNGQTPDKMADNKRRAHELIHEAIEATVLQLTPIADVINSSMNFRGNNPIITTRPSVRHRPEPPSVVQQLPKKSSARPPPLPKQSVKTSTAAPAAQVSKSQSVRPSHHSDKGTRQSTPLVGSTSKPSRISFAPTQKSSSPKSHKSSARRSHKSSHKLSSVSGNRSMMRPSQFQQHTGSDALKSVLKEIDMKTSSEESSFDLESE